jgi:hypothetical protein
LWLGVPSDGDYDGVRYASTFRLEPALEDVRYTAPFACEFDAFIDAAPIAR